MELILQRDLPHQQRAVDAVCAVLDGVQIQPPVQFYENPQIRLNDPLIKPNIDDIQLSAESGVAAEHRGFSDKGKYLGLDVKMETGTGKTYVYTNVMFELHKRYGLNKFIIAVPSLAIKAGTSQFLTEDYARRHFKDICGYDTDVEVCVLESVKRKKKGRNCFPSAVGDFIRGSYQNKRCIYVLLVNMQLLTGASKMLTRNDYDGNNEGFYRPLDAIRATRPIVLIDEPHRFSREQSAYKVIADEINPQLIIRFGATFKEHQNLLYNLNACSSFNQGLIKGVAKEHFEAVSGRAEKIKIQSVVTNKSAVFHHKKGNETPKPYTLAPGDSLSVISPAFEGVVIDAIKRSGVIFSNGIEKSTGEEMDVEIYMTSYQEEMLRLALQRHFETERVNFCERKFKIKTLALFFIDDISSYRADKDGKEPYLLAAFERLLKERIETTIACLNESEKEYKAYLESNLADISACHAGYFSQDNSNSDDAIAREVDIILRGKKQLLAFRDKNGNANTLRFLFSKWTLKEGWDNPNVFTIAKLRSSGSEISKLQEVGRGLRLPVDENGNRISNDDFQLNYIVDFTEADFAQKLVEQINGEIPQTTALTESQLAKAAKARGITADALFDTLYRNGYIDRNMNMNPENRTALYEDYPEFSAGIGAGKVTDRNKSNAPPVKIRPAVYNEMRQLWEMINKRYLLVYNPELNNDLENALLGILQKGVFGDVVMKSTREIVRSDNGMMAAELSSGVQYTVTRPIPYGEFLRRVSRAVNVPITTLHTTICEYAKTQPINAEHFNQNSVAAFTREFITWKNKNIAGKFSYAKSNAPLGATKLSHADGTPKESISQGLIGTKIKAGDPSTKYLYDAFAYDSPLELENITANIDEVVVYGKFPRCSIAIPTTNGGTYSPDFMYIVKKRDGGRELNIVVETKDVALEDALRGEEKLRENCARVFFESLRKDGYEVRFRTQIRGKEMSQLINDVLAQNME
ncbi:MAG: type III restriction-modification system endonuclease [Defluviitaleaceae bacterium]|nr:type III restriction-modification system endonuclease [Defluviitaleaceae bacterium]MCL2263838.1 type III restriction-modification system endonuclease [Defluviitaleaceae bacterium]